MNGATTDPWLRTINIPNIARTIMIGSNQYFFLSTKNAQNSFKKSIIQDKKVDQNFIKLFYLKII